MRRITLGKSGLSVSSIGLGFWQAASRAWGSRLRVSDIAEALSIAAREGVDFLDTAEVYGWGESEKLLGEALRRVGRSGFIVASKVAGFRVHRDDVLKAAKAIRDRLGFTIDLLQLHWPPPVWRDICEPIRGLERAVVEGYAAYYGLSNFDASEVEKALECTSRLEPVSDQVQYSLAFRTPELRLKPLLESKGITLIAWSPLAKGALAGAKASSLAQRMDPVFAKASQDSILQSKLRDIADKLGATQAQVALAWLISRNTLPIVGFRNPGRVAEIARSALLELPDWAIEELDEASSRYLREWGERVWSSLFTRFAPGLLQKIAIRIMGGV